MNQYRIVRINTDMFVSPTEVKESVKWEGADINALSEKYPPSKIYGADHFHGGSIEDGYISWCYRFERLENEAWVKCEDPRVRRVKGLTELEQEIERENRRDFPGDYYEEDEDYAYDPVEEALEDELCTFLADEDH